jgi:hypothetical protein
MRHIEAYSSFKNDFISENLSYHLNEDISLLESVFRLESESWLDLVNESRNLFYSGKIGLTEDEIWLVGTDAGRKGIYEGREVLLDVPFEDVEELHEAEYRGRKVRLNRPFRTPSGPRKFGVYTKNDKGNIVVVKFGDPNMEIKRDNPARRKSYRARHQCDTNLGPKWKANYWSCKFWSSKPVSSLASEDYDDIDEDEDEWLDDTFVDQEELFIHLPELRDIQESLEDF